MKALVFYGPGQIGLETVPIPRARAGEAVIRVTLTTICGTDLHILRGEYPVKADLIIGHEPVGIIHELGEGVTGYEVGDRVLVGAITPCGQCNFCLGGNWSQCGGPLGGWKFGNTINGAQAEYLLVPHAQANLAKIPDELADEQVVLLTDIASTGISAAESADLQIGDTVAVFAQGPIGICATAGARLRGASLIIAVESDPIRTEMSKRMGADVVIDFTKEDVVESIKHLTRGRGVDVPSRRWVPRPPSRAHSESSGRVELSPAWVCTLENSRCRPSRLQPASEITESSPHFVRAAKNACAG
jgi:threonine dehydrogenase-like Zn-dependent dehydrogenase